MRQTAAVAALALSVGAVLCGCFWQEKTVRSVEDRRRPAFVLEAMIFNHACEGTFSCDEEKLHMIVETYCMQYDPKHTGRYKTYQDCIKFGLHIGETVYKRNKCLANGGSWTLELPWAYHPKEKFDKACDLPSKEYCDLTTTYVPTGTCNTVGIGMEWVRIVKGLQFYEERGLHEGDVEGYIELKRLYSVIANQIASMNTEQCVEIQAYYGWEHICPEPLGPIHLGDCRMCMENPPEEDPFENTL